MTADWSPAERDANRAAAASDPFGLPEPASPTPLAPSGVHRDAQGRWWADGARFANADDAHEYLAASAALQTQIELLVMLERVHEQQAGVLERMRAQVMQITARTAELQAGSSAANAEAQEQLTTTMVAVELGRAERTVAGQLGAAAETARAYPLLIDAWSAGEIQRGHVRAIARAGEVVDDTQRAAFERETLARAFDGSGELRTPAQLARIARRLAQQFTPRPLAERAAEAYAERALWHESLPDGMALLTVKTSAVLAEAALSRLRSAAKSAAADDPRTMPQHMADTAMAALITGTCDAGLLEGVNASVTITMPATLLTGAPGAQPAELASGTLIDDDTALLLAADAPAWTRLFTDPVTGVAVSADLYRPTASLRRLITARDQRCRFPGCSRPAGAGDIDHTVAWEDGGRTTPDNLAALCRRHHTLKHRLGPNAGWQVRQTSPGVLQWRGPDGRVRSVAPEPVPAAVQFRKVDAEPPGDPPW